MNGTAGRIALVTGGNQGLGLALVRGLCARLGPADVVYLTARDETRGRAAMESLGEVTPELRFARLDVTDTDNVQQLAAKLSGEHGGLDIVISNAAARMPKDQAPADYVRHFIDTNNHGTCRMLVHFLPALRENGRFVVVASSFGRLSQLPENLHDRFDTDTAGLEDIEAVMDAYVAAVENGTAAGEGWPDWVNVASKVGQVALARIAARMLTAERPNSGILVNAACPGLVDTEASRPWFDDMSKAQSPDDAAQPLLDLALTPPGASEPQGELMRFGKALAWT
jgi:NAD(P)-dependent dehydrogenase (short-subunit alcohol dehydrogenase family)